jgi:HEAT repeats
LSGSRRRYRFGVVRVGAVLALVAAAGEERPRASGGVRLVEALEVAPAAVVAVVAEPRQVDAHGYAARLSVESALAGRVPAGAELQIGWEELATSRAPRFANGERVLLALEPLPGDSIWATRFPDPVLRSRVFGVSMRGNAFLRAPSPRAVERLEHYLKLAAKDREGSNGVVLLAELAADSEPQLAVGAAERLARHSELEATLDPPGAALVVRALQRTDAGPALSAALLEAIARERPPALRAPLEALASREPLAPAVVFEALAALDSGVAPARTARLRGASPAHREVVARHASGPTARAELARLARNDPEPAVRAAAIERLMALGGASAVEDGLTALHDPAPTVRGAAARALGTLGASSVEGLRRTVDSGNADAARAAVVALQLTGSPEASEALAEIAESHRDESVRTLAAIALGRQIGHKH